VKNQANGLSIFLLLLAASLGLFATLPAEAELEVTCAEIVGANLAPISQRLKISESASDLSEKIQARAQETAPALAQYQIFKLLSKEFENVMVDSQKILAYFYENDGENDLNPDISTIGTNAKALRAQAEKLRKMSNPSFWRKILTSDEAQEKAKIERLIAEIRACRATATACAANLESNLAPIDQHIRDIQRLLNEVNETRVLIPETLKAMKQNGADDATILAAKNATDGLLNEFAMTATLLVAHMDHVERDIQLANVSLETVRSLTPLLVSEVALGAPSRILHVEQPQKTKTPGASVTDSTDTGKVKMTTKKNEASVEQIDMKLNEIQTYWPHRTHQPYLEAMKKPLSYLAEDPSSYSMYKLADLVQTGWQSHLSDAILEKQELLGRYITDESGPKVYELIRANQFMAATAILLMNESPTATKTLLEVLENNYPGDLISPIYSNIAFDLRSRKFDETALPVLRKMALSGHLELDPTWAAIQAIENIGSAHALQTLKELRKSLDTQPYTEIYKSQIDTIISNLSKKLETETPLVKE
jgi:hypothetical protein